MVMMFAVPKSWKGSILLTPVIVAGVLLGWVSVAQCQTSSTRSRLTLQGPAEQSGSPVIRDALNRPCLDVEAAARAHVINPDMVDHVVSVKNSCPRPIKLKICYFQSDRCKEVDVQAYKRVDTILGTMTKIFTFRYSVFQK